jgi:hypothetical protein
VRAPVSPPSSSRPARARFESGSDSSVVIVSVQ